MYLSRRIFIGANYEHRGIEGKVSLTKKEYNTDIKKPIKIDVKKISYIEESVGYWRKANQIHNWFVQNVQKGIDDCGSYDVSKEQLKELLKICKRIKKECILVPEKIKEEIEPINKPLTNVIEPEFTMQNAKLAKRILPTSEGFFFGSTDYDGYYMEVIDSTIEIIKELFKTDTEEANYSYSSSW